MTLPLGSTDMSVFSPEVINIRCIKIYSHRLHLVELTPGIALNFFTSVEKGLKLKVRKLLGLISQFIEKLVRRE